MFATDVRFSNVYLPRGQNPKGRCKRTTSAGSAGRTQLSRQIQPSREGAKKTYDRASQMTKKAGRGRGVKQIIVSGVENLDRIRIMSAPVFVEQAAAGD